MSAWRRPAVRFRLKPGRSVHMSAPRRQRSARASYMSGPRGGISSRRFAKHCKGKQRKKEERAEHPVAPNVPPRAKVTGRAMRRRQPPPRSQHERQGLRENKHGGLVARLEAGTKTAGRPGNAVRAGHSRFAPPVPGLGWTGRRQPFDVGRRRRGCVRQPDMTDCRTKSLSATGPPPKRCRGRLPPCEGLTNPTTPEATLCATRAKTSAAASVIDTPGTVLPRVKPSKGRPWKTGRPRRNVTSTRSARNVRSRRAWSPTLCGSPDGRRR
jgi:hypothetical protein